MTISTRPPRKRNQSPVDAYFEAHRLQGFKARLARAGQDAGDRPKPSLARVRWLELPLLDDDQGGQS
jgi:hypothetical protein